MLHPTHRHAPTGRRPAASAAGLTLIEILVTMVIVSVLAAVAVPLYTDYVTRSRIVSATNELAAMRSRMEQFFQDNRTYVGGPCGTAVTAETFSITCTGAGAPTATTYTLSATGSGPTNGFTYTINQAGDRNTSSLGSGWTLPASHACWIVKKGGTC